MKRIGISVTNQGIEEGLLPILQELGYTDVDYGILGDYATPLSVFSESKEVWTKYFEDRKKLFASYGLNVYQTHGTYNTDYDVAGEITDKIIAQFEKEIEATAILGAKYIIIHPICFPVSNIQKEKERAINLEFYRALVPTLQKFGVKIAIENMYGHDYARMRRCPTAASSSPEDLKYYLDELDSDCFCVCLDTGHANICNFRPEDYVRLLGGRLCALHVNDNNGICDEHTAPYMGSVNWINFVKALKEIGYHGAFSMETSRYVGMPKGVAKAYLKYAYDVTRTLLEE